MRAWRIRARGEPSDVLSLDEVPEPKPGRGELAVRVEAVTLNFPDVLLCRGAYQESATLPFTPGMDATGRVVATGPGTTTPVGRRVAGVCHPPHGGLAEVALHRENETFAIPDELPAVTAAAMGVTYQTGYIGLHRRAGLLPGETLLVHAAAGGVGSAALQLGQATGARVLAAANGQAKTAICRRLGADVVIDYETEDFVERVKDLTDGRGADVIYDPVGGDMFDRSRKAVAFEGRIVVVGFTGGRIASAPTNHVLIKNYAVLGLHLATYWARDPGLFASTYKAVLRLHAAGAIAPLISERVAPHDVPSALTGLAARRTVGKIVVDYGAAARATGQRA